MKKEQQELMNSSAPKSSFPVHISKNTSTKRERGQRSRISLSRMLPAVLRRGQVFRPKVCFACLSALLWTKGSWHLFGGVTILQPGCNFWLAAWRWLEWHVFFKDSPLFECSSWHFGSSWSCVLRWPAFDHCGGTIRCICHLENEVVWMFISGRWVRHSNSSSGD